MLEAGRPKSNGNKRLPEVMAFISSRPAFRRFAASALLVTYAIIITLLLKQPASTCRSETTLLARTTLVSVNEYFDRVFYINRDIDTEKRDIMRALFDKNGIEAERFPAIEATSAAVVEASHKYKVALESTSTTDKMDDGGDRQGAMTPTDFALLATFGSLFETAKKRGYSRILVLGDAVRIHHAFAAEFDRQARALPPNWKILHLGADSEPIRDGEATAGADDDSPVPTQHSRASPQHPRHTVSGAFAVGIDASLFDILSFGVRTSVRPFDTGVLHTVASAYKKHTHVTTPHLFIKDELSNTDSHGFASQSGGSHRHSAPLSMYAPRCDPAPLPKVCTVITLFNAEQTIAYSIRSLLGQTYTNIEVVVVDDASSDTSFSIVQQLAMEDPRVRAVRNTRNVGAYASRNIGIRHCTGVIYMNHDADDVAAPNRVASQIGPILDNRAEVTLALFVRTHATVEELALPWNALARRVTELRVHRKLSGDFFYCCKDKLAMATMMLRRSVFDRIGTFDDSRHSGDAEFLERYLALTMGYFFGSDIGTPMQVHDFLWHTPPLPPYYERIDRIIYVGADLNSSLSHVIPIGGAERLDRRREYQRNIRIMAGTETTANSDDAE